MSSTIVKARIPQLVIDIIKLDVGSQKRFSRKISFYNKAKILGIYSVLKDIFRKFIKFKKLVYQEQLLKIIVRDQITITRLLAIQSESIENTKLYDKYIQLVVLPTQLYITINYSYTILSTYYTKNSTSKGLVYTYQVDTIFQNIKYINTKKPKYFIYQNLIYRSYQSYIITLFEQELIDRSLLDFNTDRERSSVDAIKFAMSQLQLY